MLRFLQESLRKNDVVVPAGLGDELELVASLRDMFEQVCGPGPACAGAH